MIDTPTFQTSPYTTELSIAKLACSIAGHIQQKYYRHQDLVIKTKSNANDLVTAVDLECDQAIRSLIQSLRPNDTLVTEESFREGQPIDMTCAWVVDPVDGTTNYAHGFPHFAVSIAYVEEGIPKVGAIYDVMKNELFTAIRGQGIYLNEQPVHVSGVMEINKALLATGFPSDTRIRQEDNMAYFQKFMTLCHGVRRAGAAALDLAYVACGRLDGFWELRLSPWDVAAGVLMVEEAGGLTSTFDGKPLVFNDRRINIAASASESLHGQIIDICQTRPCISS